MCYVHAYSVVVAMFLQRSYAYLVCYVFLALDYIVLSVIMFGMNSYLTHIE